MLSPQATLSMRPAWSGARGDTVSAEAFVQRLCASTAQQRSVLVLAGTLCMLTHRGCQACWFCVCQAFMAVLGQTVVRLSRAVHTSLQGARLCAFLLCREELEGKAKGVDIFHEDWCVRALVNLCANSVAGGSWFCFLEGVPGRR